LSALVGVLAAHEGEAHGAVVVLAGSRNRPADSAAISFGIGEAIPVDRGGFQAAGEDAAGPVGFSGDGSFAGGDDAGEGAVFGDLGVQSLFTRLSSVWTARPEENAGGVGIA
jgi:hypothetical protein